MASRTQFCAAVVHDRSSSYQFYVIEGADFESQDVLADVYVTKPLIRFLSKRTTTRPYLSIPSFKWYRSGSLTECRMIKFYQPYDRQILGVEAD